MKKRFVTGAITLLSALTLAACAAGSSEDTKLVTMKGDTITVSDFYGEVKKTEAAQTTMLTLILSKVFEEQYGKDVTEEQVTEAYNKTADQYGDNFVNVLRNAGLTPESYKKELRKNLLLDYAVEQAAKQDITDETYQKAYETYVPEVTAQVIVLQSEEEAKAVLEQVRAEGADFAAIAKEKTRGGETEYKFDSGDKTLPKEVREVAQNQDINAISEITSVTNQQGLVGYYIVKTLAKAEKNPDWTTAKERLEKILLDERKADNALQRQVIAAALEKANVKIKDDTFANILSPYAATDEAPAESQPAE